MQIGITHLNLDQDIALAEEVEGVALYTGGHEHSKLSRYVNSTVIAKADANAKTVYIHRVKVDPHTGMTKINSEIRVIEFESLENKFVLFPNPTTDYINIKFNEEAGVGNIQIFSSTGQLDRSTELNAGAHQQTIPLTDLPKGSYHLLLDQNGVTSNRKIVVQ